MVYLHDGTFEGMLHAVAVAVKSTDEVIGIHDCNHYVPTLLYPATQLDTDRRSAQRLVTYLRGLNRKAVRYAFNGFLSEDESAGIHLFWMVKHCLENGAKATENHTHESIRSLASLSQRVRKEAHRFTGLIRFRVMVGDVQYAPFEPDCNVIGYCAHHFRKRLRNRQWILHDIRRDHAFYWNGTEFEYIEIDKEFTRSVLSTGEIPDTYQTEDELYYQNLWRLFHNSIANETRENPALQRQRMPNRYWKYLTEME